MNTKIVVLFLAITVNYVYVHGQNYIPFPTTNATWSTYITEEFWEPPFESHHYRYYKLNGDTIINNKAYSIVSSSNYTNYCYFREENKVIYCRYHPRFQLDTSEFVLYNFNIQLGDTMVFPKNSGYNSFLIVTSEDSVLIGSKYHRIISVDDNAYFQFQFIEGIGASNGLMYHEVPIGHIWGNLDCFSLNDTIYNISGNGSYSLGHCFQNTGIIEGNSFSDLCIFPNPTLNLVNIESKEFSEFELYDLYGKIKVKSNFPYLHLKDFPDGIYLLRVFNINGISIKTEKIIKE